VRIEPGASEGLDAALAPDLVLRPARAGDRLAGRRSTVRRLLADARVPRALRDAYPVVVARGEVVSIPGLAVAPAHLREHGLAITVEHGNE
jgi:tRNA(Ile)-lysidine synthetase-like protein